MLRRIFALALTAAMMSAPLSLALCHVECANATASRDQPAHHSCHESSAPAAVAMTAVPHACGHADETLAGFELAQQAVTAPVAVVPLAVWASPSSAVARIATVDIQYSPPGSFQLVSQLRV